MTPSPNSSMSTPALPQNASTNQQQPIPSISTSSSLRLPRNRPLADQQQRRLQATAAMSPTQQLEDATKLSPATLDHLRTLEREYQTSRSSGMDPLMPLAPKKGSSRRGTDIEFATEIGQGLLIEVRKLQMVLQQKDQQLKDVLERKADLERNADMMVKQLRQREEMQEQLKNQTWDLELAKQDLSGNVTELQQSLNRSHIEQSRLTKQLNDVRAELDRMRDREEKLNATIETIKTRHEHDMGVVRRHAASLQREKLDHKKQMDSLLSELAIARAQSRMMARPENLPRVNPSSSSIKSTLSTSATTTQPSKAAEISKGSDKKSDGEQTASSASNTNNKGGNSGQGLEVETLKSSLAHAHRMVSNLRTNLHKEKTEKFELKKLLAESQETIEQLQSEMWVDQPTPRRLASATPMGTGSVSTTTSTGLVSTGTSGPVTQGPSRRRRVRRRIRKPVRFEAGGDNEEGQDEDEEEEIWSEGSFDESDDGTRTPPPLETQQQQPLSVQLTLADQLRPFTPSKMDQAIQTDEVTVKEDQPTISMCEHQPTASTSTTISTANALSALDRGASALPQKDVVNNASPLSNNTTKEDHTATTGATTSLPAQHHVVHAHARNSTPAPEPKQVRVPTLEQQMSSVNGVTQQAETADPSNDCVQAVVDHIQHERCLETVSTLPPQRNQPMSLADELSASASKPAEQQRETPAVESKGSDAYSIKTEDRSVAKLVENEAATTFTNTPALDQRAPTSEDLVPTLVALLRQEGARHNKSVESKGRPSSDDTLIDLYIPAMLELLHRYAAGETPESSSKTKEQEISVSSTPNEPTVHDRTETTPVQAVENVAPSQNHAAKQVLEAPKPAPPVGQVVETLEHSEVDRKHLVKATVHLSQEGSAPMERLPTNRDDESIHCAVPLSDADLASVSTATVPRALEAVSLQGTGADMYTSSQRITPDRTSPRKKEEFTDAAIETTASAAPALKATVAGQPITLADELQSTKLTKTDTSAVMAQLTEEAPDMSSINAHQESTMLTATSTGTMSSTPLSDHRMERISEPVQFGVVSDEQPRDTHKLVPEVEGGTAKMDTNGSAIHEGSHVLASPSEPTRPFSTAAQRSFETTPSPILSTEGMSSESTAPVEMDQRATVHAPSSVREAPGLDTSVTTEYTVVAEASITVAKPAAEKLVIPASTATTPIAAAKVRTNEALEGQEAICTPEIKSTPVVVSQEKEALVPVETASLPVETVVLVPREPNANISQESTPAVSVPVAESDSQPNQAASPNYTDSTVQVSAAAEVVTAETTNKTSTRSAQASEKPLLEITPEDAPIRSAEHVSSKPSDQADVVESVSVSTTASNHTVQTTPAPSTPKAAPIGSPKHVSIKPSGQADVVESVPVLSIARNPTVQTMPEPSTLEAAPIRSAKHVSSKPSDHVDVVENAPVLTIASDHNVQTAPEALTMLGQFTRPSTDGTPSDRATINAVSTGSNNVHTAQTPIPPKSLSCQVVNSAASIIVSDPQYQKTSPSTNIQQQHQHRIVKEVYTSTTLGTEAASPEQTVSNAEAKKEADAQVSIQTDRELSSSTMSIQTGKSASQQQDLAIADLSVGQTSQHSASSSQLQPVPEGTQKSGEYGHATRFEEAKVLTQSEADAMVIAALEAYRRKSAQGSSPMLVLPDEHSPATGAVTREPEQNYGVAYVSSHTLTYHARRESGSSGISTLTERRISSQLDVQLGNSAISLITQTMIGNYMWKYTRKAVGQGLSERRHQRFFWIHPYTRTLYWSVDAPGTRGREAKAKSALIENVAIIATPHPDHLPASSLLIKTTGRPIKITAPDTATHEVWHEALLYLLDRSENDTGLGRMDVAESLSSSAISTLRRPQLRNTRSTGSFAGSVARRRAAVRNFRS